MSVIALVDLPRRSSNPFMAGIQLQNQHLKVYRIQAKRTISMSMTDQHGVNVSQPILWEPLDSSRLEILAHVNDNGPEQPSLSSRTRRRAA